MPPPKRIPSEQQHGSCNGISNIGRDGWFASFLHRYKAVLLAVVFTTMITRQATMISMFHTFDNNNNNCHQDGDGDTVVVGTSNGLRGEIVSVLSDYKQNNNKQSHNNNNKSGNGNHKRERKETTTTTVSSTSSSTSTSIKKKDNAQPPPWRNQYSFEPHQIPSRAWKPFQYDFPCFPPGNGKGGKIMSTEPCHEGILFQRPTKVGSTTMTNIVLRTVHNRGGAIEAKTRKAAAAAVKRRNQTNANTDTNANTNANSTEWEEDRPWCQHRSIHGTAIAFDYPHRDKTRSFLLSLVRDPTSRVTSQFFHFEVTYARIEPTDSQFQKFAIHPEHNPLIRDLTFDATLGDAMKAEFASFMKAWNQKQKRGGNRAGMDRRFEYEKDNHTATTTITTTDTDTDTDTTKEVVSSSSSSINYTEVVGAILDNYDFIAVTERMDESLVALKLLLGLSVDEILYAKNSRAAGSFSNGPSERPCMYLVPSFHSRGMTDFFYTPAKNERWIAFSGGDALLHRAASASLDRTIDEVFGRALFDRELLEFRNAEAYASAVCQNGDKDEPNLVLGLCDEQGRSVQKDPNRSTTCYIWAEGCDHKCLNEKIPVPIPRAILDGTQTFPAEAEAAAAAG